MASSFHFLTIGRIGQFKAMRIYVRIFIFFLFFLFAFCLLALFVWDKTTIDSIFIDSFLGHKVLIDFPFSISNKIISCSLVSLLYAFFYWFYVGFKISSLNKGILDEEPANQSQEGKEEWTDNIVTNIIIFAILGFIMALVFFLATYAFYSTQIEFSFIFWSCSWLVLVITGILTFFTRREKLNKYTIDSLGFNFGFFISIVPSIVNIAFGILFFAASVLVLTASGHFIIKRV